MMWNLEWKKRTAKRKAWLPLILLLAVILTGILPVYAADTPDAIEISVTMHLNSNEAYINNESYQLDQPPLIMNDRTLVPLRFFSEALGATVQWEPSSQTIRLEQDTRQITLVIGYHKAHVNGQKVSLDTAPVIVGGRTLVPVRFISEVMGFDVKWDAASRSILITGKTTACQLAAVMADYADREMATMEPASAALDLSPWQAHTQRRIEMEVLRLVNVEREKAGLDPLNKCDHLMYVASMKSLDLVENRYFSHTSPVYGGMRDLLETFEVSFQRAGENIATGQRTPEEVVKAWMDSPGHRANILNPDFHLLGVGAVDGGQYGGVTWTQLFTD